MSIVMQCLKQLTEIPERYVRDLSEGEAGWFMHLGVPSASDGRLPGVYSTSFAIQLLCGAPAPEKPAIRKLLRRGMAYLIAQYREAQKVAAGTITTGKQFSKQREVGHTDFQLVLKCTVVIEAANAIAAIRHKHQDFGTILSEFQVELDAIAAELKNGAISYTEGGKTFQGWPWHFLSGESRPDVVPTVHVALALTDVSLRSTTRYLDEIDSVANYLNHAVTAETIFLHQAFACNVLLEIGERLNRDMLAPDALELMKRQFREVAGDLDNYSWQEVLHYSVPAHATAVSHYKPWIWLFPKLQLSECMLRIDLERAATPCSSSTAAVIRNIKANHGEVHYMTSQPATLLENLRTFQFLSHYKARILNSWKGHVYLLVARGRLAFTAFLDRHLWVVFVPWAALLFVAVRSTPRRLAETGSVVESVNLLTQSWSRISSVWPIWLLLVAICLITGEGSLARRVRQVIQMLLFSVFLGVLISLLAA